MFAELYENSVQLWKNPLPSKIAGLDYFQRLPPVYDYRLPQTRLKQLRRIAWRYQSALGSLPTVQDRLIPIQADTDRLPTVPPHRPMLLLPLGRQERLEHVRRDVRDLRALSALNFAIHS